MRYGSGEAAVGPEAIRAGLTYLFTHYRRYPARVPLRLGRRSGAAGRSDRHLPDADGPATSPYPHSRSSSTATARHRRPARSSSTRHPAEADRSHVHTDIAVIGAGIGGLTLGSGAAQARHRRADLRARPSSPRSAPPRPWRPGTRSWEPHLGDPARRVLRGPVRARVPALVRRRRLVAHPVGDWYAERFGAPVLGRPPRATCNAPSPPPGAPTDLHLGGSPRRPRAGPR